MTPEVAFLPKNGLHTMYIQVPRRINYTLARIEMSFQRW